MSLRGLHGLMAQAIQDHQNFRAWPFGSRDPPSLTTLHAGVSLAGLWTSCPL
jgi:hypothetical protein